MVAALRVWVSMPISTMLQISSSLRMVRLAMPGITMITKAIRFWRCPTMATCKALRLRNDCLRLRKEALGWWF